MNVDGLVAGSTVACVLSSVPLMPWLVVGGWCWLVWLGWMDGECGWVRVTYSKKCSNSPVNVDGLVGGSPVASEFVVFPSYGLLCAGWDVLVRLAGLGGRWGVGAKS